MAMQMPVETGALGTVIQGHRAVIALLQQEITLTQQLQAQQRSSGQRVVVSGQTLGLSTDSRGAAPPPIIGMPQTRGTATAGMASVVVTPDARGRVGRRAPGRNAPTRDIRGGLLMGALDEARAPSFMNVGPGGIVPGFVGAGGGRAAIRIRRRARALAMGAEFPELQQQLDNEIARARRKASVSRAGLATLANNSAAITNALARGDFAGAAGSAGVLLRESQSLQRRFGQRAIGGVGAGLFGIARGYEAGERMGEGLQATASMLSDFAIVTATGAAIGGGVPGAAVAAAAFIIGSAGQRVKRAITGEDRNIAAKSRRQMIEFIRSNRPARYLKASDIEDILERGRNEDLRKALESGSIAWIDYKLTSNEKLDAKRTEKLGKAAKDIKDTINRSYDAARLGNLQGAAIIERGFFTRNEDDFIRDEFNAVRVPIGSAAERWFRWQNALIQNRNWAALESKRGPERTLD